MISPVYPDTALRVGQVDPPFGGEPADAFGGPAWQWAGNAIRELQVQVVDDQWGLYRFVRARMATSGVAGDVVIFDLAGNESDYTIARLASVTYSASVTPYFGVLAESASRGDKAKIILSGGGIPPSITGLRSGDPGVLTFNTASGRLKKRTVSTDPAVGHVNSKGHARLFDWQETSSAAEALLTADGPVDVSASSAPSAGQVLTASGASAAMWADPLGSSALRAFATLYARHPVGSGAAPSIAAGQTAGGADPTIVGSDAAGTITVPFGGAIPPTPGTVMATITFDEAWVTAPIVIVTPISPSIRKEEILATTPLWEFRQSEVTTTEIILRHGPAGCLPNPGTYVWNYIAVGRHIPA